MADAATAIARIAEIEAILATGQSRRQVDGHVVELDLTALERERDRLSRIVAQTTHSPFRRVVFRDV